VAILYVIAGLVGMLPGLLILVLAATGSLFWLFFLRVASPPVSFEAFVHGVQTSLLQTWPDFPFGIVGLAVLAIHFLAAIPAAPMGLAVVRGSPAAERALRGLGVLYLVVFPVGTVLGLAALASMGRASAAPLTAGEMPSRGERTAAAACYAVPVLAAIYFFVKGPASAFVRVHAIQSSALFAIFYAAAKLLESSQSPSHLLVGGSMWLVLFLLAAIAYGGRDFRFPLIGPLAERVQKQFARGQQQLQAMSALRLHQRNLAGAVRGPPPSVITPIEGTKVGNGFEQRSGKSADRPLLFVAGAFAIVLLFVLGSGWRKLGDGNANILVVVVTMLFFGLMIGSAVLLMVHKFLTSVAAEGRLLVRDWPLKLGGDVRMQYKAKPRRGGKIESIDVALKCQEMIAWRDSRNRSRTSGGCIHDVVLPPIRAQVSADGSVTAEWTVRVPREAPPSFTAQGGWIHWMLMVEMRIEGAPDSSQTYSMLVIPEMAA
jgi:uncharacterized membrane protein